MNKTIFSIFILIILFSSCTSDKKAENVPENDFPINTDVSKIISIYLAENQMDIWSNYSGEFKVIKSHSFPNHLFFPLGIQIIKSIQKEKITIELPSDKVASKLKMKQLKTSFLDSVILLENPLLEEPINPDVYSLIVVPSKPDEYGNFKACTSCPFIEQQLYLKCKLEWEGIFGNFEKIQQDGISNSE